MSKEYKPTNLNNTPNVIENVAEDAPQSKIARAHRRGSALTSRGIVSEWWWLRITAALLVPLSVWFLVSLITKLIGVNAVSLDMWFDDLFTTIAAVVMLLVTFVHTRLGVHEIMIDYIHHPAAQRAFFLLVDLLCLVLCVGSVAAVIHLHLV